MTVFLRILRQLLLILVGYAAAAIVASAFLHLIFLTSAGFDADEAPVLVMGSVVFSIPFVALFTAYFAFLPAVVAIGIGEVLGARDWLYYSIAGGVVGACVIALFWYYVPPSLDLEPGAIAHRDPLVENPYVLSTIIGAGVLGGIAYWAVAGRLAGSWKSRPTLPAR